MPNTSIAIDSLPHLDDMPAAYGALAPHSQITGPNIFDIIITVVIQTGGK